MAQNSLGFFLHGNGCLYNFSLFSEVPSQIDLDLPDELQEYITPFYEIITQSNLIFSYAAYREERNHRNRCYKTIGINEIEDWVGRDIRKYVPGLYCFTLISEDLIEKHITNFSALVSSAIEHKKLGKNGHLHLLRFYDDIKSWKFQSKRLDELCYRTDGIFSIKRVLDVVESIDNYPEYDDVISNWR